MCCEIWKDITQTSFFWLCVFFSPSLTLCFWCWTQWHRAASGLLTLHLDVMTLGESTWQMGWMVEVSLEATRTVLINSTLQGSDCKSHTHIP